MNDSSTGPVRPRNGSSLDEGSQRATTGVDNTGSNQASQSQGAGANPQDQPFVASTAPLTFTDFLEKMRAPAAMDLVRGIKSFISEMLKSGSSDAEADGQKVQDFLARSESAFRSHPLWIESTPEEFEAAGEGLEKYLLTKLYGRCFGVAGEDKERDELLNQRMKALGNFVKPEHLDIPDKYCNESSWMLAQKELKKINTYKAPRDKLVCILNCCRVISNLLSVSEEGAGADDFLPILIYVLIMAAPPHLESNLAFILRYRLASRLTGEAAYFYTNMVSATTFIETIEPNSLSIDPAEFIAHMQAAGVPGSEAPLTVNTNVNPAPGSSAADVSSDPKVVGEEEKRRTMTMTASSAASEEMAKGKRQEESHIAAAADAPAPQQGTEERRFSNLSSASGGGGVGVGPASSLNLLPLSAVEEKGSGMLLEAEGLGELHMRYKFLYTSLSDLKLKDVKVLLDDYKEIALKYESLSRGYKLMCGEDVSSAQTSAPPLVKAFHRVDPVHDDSMLFGNASALSTNSSENLIRLADSPKGNAGNNNTNNNNNMGNAGTTHGATNHAQNAGDKGNLTGLPEPPNGSANDAGNGVLNQAPFGAAGAVQGGDVFNSLPTPPINTNNSSLPDLLG